MSGVDAIHKRMLDNISNEYDKTEGSFFYDATKPAAIEFENKSKEIQEVANKLDVENLEGEELERYVYQHTGTVIRKPATKSSGKVIIKGQEGAIISKGDLVSADTVNFVITENKKIDETGRTEVTVRCEEAGAIGNVPAGAIKYFPVSIPGLTSVTNPQSVTNGYDAEPDIELLERYYERIRTPATSGNKYHYLNWAKEVVGVGNARVVPLWQGDNTVKVTIIDSNMQPASEELVAQVQEYIDPNITGLGEGQAPIGAFCTVVAAIAKPIDVSFTVTKDVTYTIDQIKSSAEAAIAEYLKNIAFKKNLVSYAQIGAIILDTEGVLDYRELRVNAGIENISVNDEEVAVLGEVVINE